MCSDGFGIMSGCAHISTADQQADVQAASASFECDLLVERRNAGLAAAQGRRGGRPTALLAIDLRTARAMLADANVSVAEFAKQFKIGRITLYRSLRRGEL